MIDGTFEIEFGSDSVEVIDDGSGISPSNFENLCLKHYTSKIEEFEDLLNVQTFGFRGEALSSLCALSALSVTTCEKGSKIGWKLEYEMLIIFIREGLVFILVHSKQI